MTSSAPSVVTTDDVSMATGTSVTGNPSNSAPARFARAVVSTNPPVAVSATVPGAPATGNPVVTPPAGAPAPAVLGAQCPAPPSVNGGATLSSGPFVANTSSAVYTCFAGYSMSGAASILCTAGGAWSGKPPDCIPNNRHWVNNHIHFGGTDFPLWLAVLLGLMFGLLALLLLTCLIMYCLRMCGCWEGSVLGCCGDAPPYGSGYTGCLCCRRRQGSRRRFRRSSVSTVSMEEGRGDLTDRRNNVFVVGEPKRTRGNRTNHVYNQHIMPDNDTRGNGQPPQGHHVTNNYHVTRENDQPPNGHQVNNHYHDRRENDQPTQEHHVTNHYHVIPEADQSPKDYRASNHDHDTRENDNPRPGQQARGKQYISTLHTTADYSGGESSGREGYATPRLVTVTQDVIQKDNRRRQAKKPEAFKMWMPHRNPVRNINTSTH